MLRFAQHDIDETSWIPTQSDARKERECGLAAKTLSVYPAIDVDLVALVLRNVERIAIRIEAAVLGHRATARPLADTAFRQRVEKLLDVSDQPAKVIEAIPWAFPFVHVAAGSGPRKCHPPPALPRPPPHPFFCAG